MNQNHHFLVVKPQNLNDANNDLVDRLIQRKLFQNQLDLDEHETVHLADHRVIFWQFGQGY
ncbi:MAG: hypothetical protein AAFQ80_05825 [Cyanobacteria bacterium J06621_8]